MRWYSLRCFFSSLGSFGGSQDGRVRDRYFCFSTDGWKGSISGSLFRTGGSVGFLVFGTVWLIDADLASPGCCLVISCFRSYSDWNSSSASVSFLASASNAVYVSAHVVCGIGDFGDTPLLDTFGDGSLWCTEGAGDGFAEDSAVPGSGDVWGVLSPVQGTGDRSCVGRGDIGIFQMTASSGTSSSSSSHSASLSLTVFRFESCQDCLLEAKLGDGKTSFRELLRESVRDPERDL